MLQDQDLAIGQLAIARSLISLPQLLRCASLLRGRPLAIALYEDGLLSQDTVSELQRFLKDAPPDNLREELLRGQTLVLASIQSASRPDGMATFATLHADNSAPLPLTAFPTSERYAIQHELGRGGMGEVWLAHDTNLGRDVALKFLREDLGDAESLRHKLLLEAQVTGMLEHPSIIPIYDLGNHGDRGAFYTMRVVREQSLETLLREMRAGAPRYTLSQLISFLRQALLALQYAHDHGVIHRDLKPENLLIGAYGEVFIIDWGIAKIGAAPSPTPLADELMRRSASQASGSLVGTPHYMAPEQARGENDLVDARSDVYAMGAVLYEILTLETVFHADNMLTLLFKASEEPAEPPTKRAPDRAIPIPLEEICLRALAKEPRLRYQSAQEMARELEQFLDGVKDQERRYQIARDLVVQADRLKRDYLRARKDYAKSVIEFIDTRAQIPSWAPVQERERLWALEQRANELRLKFERTFGEAIRTYSQALGYAPQLGEAREALADLYWQRFQLAEASGDEASAIYFEGLVRQYNDGNYDTLLEGLATLDLDATPAPERVQIYRYEPGMQRLLPRLVQALAGPIQRYTLPHGSYLLLVERAGHAPLRVPLKLERLEHASLHLKLRALSELPSDMIIVTAGEYLGGQIDPVDLDRHRRHINDFAIGRFPVTCREYLEFLNDLAANGALEEAIQHAPRTSESAPSYFAFKDGAFSLPEEDAEGDRWDLDWPICLVSCHDAEAYAAWRSAREGRRYRLPSADEWEKAARGVDGRLYPWGNSFDPAFCCMRDSHKGRPLPAVIGTYPYDCSPYGAMDMAGNMMEWTSSWTSEAQQSRILQGASFNSLHLICRLDWNSSSPTTYRYGHYGFRVAMELT
jgi:serine/threonine protein kinase/formylglycine-generating enzyme required for sulfatase activity